jgi:hypothetical protein
MRQPVAPDRDRLSERCQWCVGTARIRSRSEHWLKRASGRETTPPGGGTEEGGVETLYPYSIDPGPHVEGPWRAELKNRSCIFRL